MTERETPHVLTALGIVAGREEEKISLGEEVGE